MSHDRRVERYIERWRFRATRLIKTARWSLRAPGNSKVLWIFGCQRSGTTLLGRIIERDSRALVLHEDSILTENEKGRRLRFQSLDQVNQIIGKIRHPFVVAKPLVESQRVPELLDRVKESRGIWVHRDYRDVINSHLRRFGSQIDFIDALAECRENDWRAEASSAETRYIINQFRSPSLRREDATALIWIARNRLFFEQGLESEPRIALIDYRNLIQRTTPTLKFIYEHLGMEFPGSSISHAIDQNSLDLGKDIVLNQDIEELCIELTNKLRPFFAPRPTSQ